ncbi:4,5-DOPA dioxygenase extradiol [Streptomyces sp. enrichment culture]|uniref:4,5-DOPA-extradiol-dioxygenase n=1 Tax=Streptomyces sp. enrichment culture TaxID=1795815 RepID=UPI003F54755F
MSGVSGASGPASGQDGGAGGPGAAAGRAGGTGGAAGTVMPAAFLGHGNPMNALERNRYTEAWRLFGASVPRPRAILVISAHWYTNATAVTAMPRPRTIHDFYGFPQELFDVQYPAPGAPDVAELVADVVKPTWVGQDIDSWGIDHGTWSVLVHAFPDASIPVVQLSLNAFKDFDHHLNLGRRLAPLREQGVLIIGSGNVVHNLRAVDFRQPDTGYDWALRFDEVARERLADDPAGVAALDGHPDFGRAVPTPDHYLPLLYIAGLADTRPLDLLVDGHAAGSISMAAYTLGLDRDLTGAVGDEPAADLPPGFPALDSNI